jgi:hypothetical protein
MKPQSLFASLGWPLSDSTTVYPRWRDHYAHSSSLSQLIYVDLWCRKIRRIALDDDPIGDCASVCGGDQAID